MAATKTELWDQLAKAIDIVKEAYNYASQNTPNFINDLNTLVTAYRGDHVGTTQSIVSSMRISLDGIIAQGASLFTPIILELAKIGYNSNASDVITALDDIYQGMIDATETVKYRNFTFGSLVTAGGNNGDGTVHRLTTGKDSHNLEGSQPTIGTVKIECTADFATGQSKGSEAFKIYGAGQTPTDNLVLGDTPPGELTVNAATNATGGLISNAGFETATGTGATLAFTNWVIGTLATNFTAYTADFFRGAQCAQFLDNDSLLQYIAKSAIDPSIPVFAILKYKRLASCDGTLTLRLGSQTAAVTLSSGTAWTTLTLGINSDIKGWYDNFKEDSSSSGIRVQVTLSARTTGTLLVDDVIIIQPKFFNGQYYLVEAGQSEFLKGDSFTYVDSAVETGQIQYHIARFFGKYFPHTSGVPTYADA